MSDGAPRGNTPQCPLCLCEHPGTGCVAKTQDQPPPSQLEFGYCLDCGELVDNTLCSYSCKWDGSDERERGSRYKNVTYIVKPESTGEGRAP